MLLTTLTYAFLLSTPQVPVHEGPDAPAAESQTSEAIDPAAGLVKLQERLIGGEWHVDEHFVKKSFQRFIAAPGAASALFVETRDKDNLSKPLPGLNVIFHDPTSNTIRGIAISDHGAFSDSTYSWQGDKLIRSYRYHLADGSMRGGVLTETTMDLESHWSFESDTAYRWQLFQKTPAGVTSILETSFVHQETLTDLPDVAQDNQEASTALEFLAPLQGQHTPTENWKLNASWRVKGMGLWTEKSIPNPYFGWHDDYPESIAFEGFYYWNPLKKETRFIGFAENGSLVRGVTALNKRQQIESTYRVGPPAVRLHQGEGIPSPLGEQIQVQEDGSLEITWVRIGQDGKPSVIEASLK